MLGWIRGLEAWGRRWGATIGIVGTAAAVLSIPAFYSSSQAPVSTSAAPVKTSAAPTTSAPLREAPPAVDAPLITKAKLGPSESWGIKIAEIERARRERDVVGWGLGCSELLAENVFSALHVSERDITKTACFTTTSHHADVRYYDRNIAGREEQLLTETKEVIARLTQSPLMSSDFSKVCKLGSESDFRANVRFSWLSIAMKAFWLAHASGLGSHVLEALDRGQSPLEALPDLPLMEGLAKAAYLSKSYMIMTTFQPDRLMQQYSDEAILKWSRTLAAMLPEAMQNSLRSTVALYLDTYRTSIKPGSHDLLRLYRQATSASDLVELDAGRLIGNFPSDTLYASCTNPHVQEFWLRRVMRGTDARLEALAAKFLSE